jgi:hypothetical protein
MRWLWRKVDFKRRGGHLGRQVKILRSTSGGYQKKGPAILVLGVIFPPKADDGVRRCDDFSSGTDFRAFAENARTRSYMVALGAYELQLSSGGTFVANGEGVDLW